MENNHTPTPPKEVLRERAREEFDVWFKEYPGTPTIGEIEQWWLERITEAQEAADKQGYYKGRMACIEQLHGTKRDPVRALMEEFAKDEYKRGVEDMKRKCLATLGKRRVLIGENGLAMRETGMSMAEIEKFNAESEGFNRAQEEARKAIEDITIDV